MLGLVATFIVQLLSGLHVVANPADTSTMQTIAVLVIICFLIGIARAWELIGGPTIGFSHEVGSILKERKPQKKKDPDDT